jgi:hypothetical protein
VKCDRLPAIRRYWIKRIVINFRTGNDRNLFVEKISQLTDDATFGLPAQAEEDGAVLGKDGVY